MAHVVVEYTANLRGETDIGELLRSVNETLIAQDGIFPIGGIRSRAIELADYRIADGEADYAFVHVTMKIGAGRPEAAKRKAGEDLFAAIKAHLKSVFEKRYLALSLELQEFDERGTYKHNNIHQRFRFELAREEP